MVDRIGFLIPGSGPGTGPILPLPLHGYGATDAAFRFVAQRLVGSDGALVTSWKDSVSGLELVNPISTLTKVVDGSMGSVLAQPASSGAQGSLSLASGVTLAANCTLVAVYKKGATGSTQRLVRASGFELQFGSSGSLNIAHSGGSGTAVAVSGTEALGNWGFAAAAFTGTSVLGVRNATSAAGTLTRGAGTDITVFNPTAQASGYRLAEIIGFNVAKSEAAIATIRAALKTHYASMV